MVYVHVKNGNQMKREWTLTISKISLITVSLHTKNYRKENSHHMAMYFHQVWHTVYFTILKLGGMAMMRLVSSLTQSITKNFLFSFFKVNIEDMLET